MDWSQSSLSFPPPKGGCHTNQHNNTETHMANNQTNLANLASSYFMTTSLSITGFSFSKSFAKGKTILAQAEGATNEKTFTSGRKLFPDGYNAELNAVKEAQNQIRTWFKSKTVPFGIAADGETASGPKLVAAKFVADGSFLTEFTQLYQTFLTAKQAFLAVYDQRVYEIERDRATGDGFNRSDYKSRQEVDDKFQVALQGPDLLANTYGLDSMVIPMDPEVRKSFEDHLNTKAKVQLNFGQQEVVEDLTKYLQTMVTNITKLADYRDNPEGKRKASIYDTLTTNITDTLDKVRAYALPDTEAGSRLLAMADKIEEELSPHELNPDVINSLPSYQARTLASRASALADALRSSDFEYH